VSPAFLIKTGGLAILGTAGIHAPVVGFCHCILTTFGEVMPVAVPGSNESCPVLLVLGFTGVGDPVTVNTVEVTVVTPTGRTEFHVSGVTNNDWASTVSASTKKAIRSEILKISMARNLPIILFII
jgi:hypothetical protein